MSESDPLCWLAKFVTTPAEAIRWACILEATAPKAGNVFPGRSFDNLHYRDFIEAAEIAAESFQSESRISRGMLAAIEKTASRCQTNVNLGIVLLLGPLVGADRRLSSRHDHRSTPERWKQAIADQLNEFDEFDGQLVFRSIGLASAGGLGRVDSLDVHDSHSHVDLMAAMKLAADRDQIARQYATGFADVVDIVAPTLRDSICRAGDLLQGISRAHVELLRWAPDSLIARKNGVSRAERVQALAQSVDLDRWESVEQFDRQLRRADHALNPGTTADLIAAGLFVLLRSQVQDDQLGRNDPIHDS
jgi:triphosphoribosyl-dephospho-CoA synthase